MNVKTLRKGRGGSTLIMTLILSSVLFIVSGSFLLLTSGEYLLNRKSYQHSAALHLAESGVDYAIWAINTGDISSWTGSDPKTRTITSFATSAGEVIGDIYIEVASPGSPAPVIHSTGYVPDMNAPSVRTRTVRTVLKPKGTSGPFIMGFFGDNMVQLTGSGVLDSYDSRIGPYGGDNVGNNCDVGTNGTEISFSGSGAVGGDFHVFGHNEGTIDISGSGTINGDLITRGDPGIIDLSGSGNINGNIITTGTTSSTIDMSGSSQVSGDLIASGIITNTIDISGSVQVLGDAATGPGGTVRVTGSAMIHGDVTHNQAVEAYEPEVALPAVVVPSELVSLGYPSWQSNGLYTLTGSRSGTIPAGNWKLRRIKLSGSTKLTIGADGQATNIYLTGYQGKSIDQSGSSLITILGDANFYVDSNVDSSGSGLWNPSGTPPSCLIWGTPTCTAVHLSGSRDLFGAVYAPSAEIHVSGSGHTYGAFVGLEIQHNGSLGFHYDEALGAVGGGGTSGWSVNYWQEKE